MSYIKILVVAFTYEVYKSLCPGRSLPEADRDNRKNEAMDTVKTGLEPNTPRSIMFTFFTQAANIIFCSIRNVAYAGRQELYDNFEDVRATMEQFLGFIRKSLDDLELQRGSQHLMMPGRSQSQQLPAPVDEPSAAQSTMCSWSQEMKPSQDHQLRDQRMEFGLAWIARM